MLLVLKKLAADARDIPQKRRQRRRPNPAKNAKSERHLLARRGHPNYYSDSTRGDRSIPPWGANFFFTFLFTSPRGACDSLLTGGRTNPVNYIERIATGASARFVDRYWFLEDDSAGAEQRVVPDGRSELIVNLGTSYEALQNGQWQVQPRTFYAGQLTRPLMLRSRGGARIFGVRFHPHGANQLLKLPMQELTDAFADMVRMPAGDPTLEGQIAAFTSLEKSGSGGEDALVAHAVAQMTAASGMVEIGEFAAMAGISVRQFERRFLNRVGLSPKLFCRIQRFQRIFSRVEQPGANWVDAAIACGYYDQAHLIRDFKEFTGRTPSALLVDADFARHFLAPTV